MRLSRLPPALFAAAILALRANDGREAIVPYTFGSGPGVYQRTPPAFGNPVAPWQAKMKPFALQSPWQFRAYGPPDLTSERYARDFQSVKELGSATSTLGTATSAGRPIAASSGRAA